MWLIIRISHIQTDFAYSTIYDIENYKTSDDTTYIADSSGTIDFNSDKLSKFAKVLQKLLCEDKQ